MFQSSIIAGKMETSQTFTNPAYVEGHVSLEHEFCSSEAVFNI